MLDRNALLDLEDDALLHACRQETYRSSGPGGQHRDKTDSAVRLTLEAYDVSVSCSEHRSQHRNRAEALRRLRNALAIEVRMPIGDACGDWQGSLKLGPKDRRYAPFLAHALDVLAEHDWAVGQSAERLGVSTGKLVRSLAHNPQAWNIVNQGCREIGLVNLRRP